MLCPRCHCSLVLEPHRPQRSSATLHFPVSRFSSQHPGSVFSAIRPGSGLGIQDARWTAVKSSVFFHLSFVFFFLVFVSPVLNIISKETTVFRNSRGSPSTGCSVPKDIPSHRHALPTLSTPSSFLVLCKIFPLSFPSLRASGEGAGAPEELKDPLG